MLLQNFLEIIRTSDRLRACFCKFSSFCLWYFRVSKLSFERDTKRTFWFGFKEMVDLGILCSALKEWPSGWLRRNTSLIVVLSIGHSKRPCVVGGRVALKSGEMWRNVGFFSCH